MRFLPASVVMLLLLANSALAEDRKQALPEESVPEANRLLVEALTARDNAEKLDPIDKVQELKRALSLLDRIVSEHPESAIAVRLVTGQRIGNFRKADLKDLFEAAFSDACLIEVVPQCNPILVERLRSKEKELSTALNALQRANNGLEEERRISEAARRQIHLLNLQIADLREQLANIQALLDDFEAKDTESQAAIADLGRRLNKALASQVEKLARYRSDFFGRLREVLKDEKGIRIVGDRFVFQSEVLFASGSDRLGVAGQIQLTKLAETLRKVMQEIPSDIDWVLRVDGHTDSRPISTARFPSNWELSAARAIAVSKFLNEHGIPANRLAPTGFASFHPVESGQSQLAFRRNRRIEFKLTDR